MKIKYIKEKYSNQKLYLFSHSMGTLVARGYMQKYDNEIEKIIFTDELVDDLQIIFRILWDITK